MALLVALVVELVELEVLEGESMAIMMPRVSAKSELKEINIWMD